MASVEGSRLSFWEFDSNFFYRSRQRGRQGYPGHGWNSLYFQNSFDSKLPRHPSGGNHRHLPEVYSTPYTSSPSSSLRYGMSGLAGVLLRQDFVEAVETLKKISGMVCSRLID
jgi:hypothetical protein